MNAFLTGSYAYKRATEVSDVDLVVFVDKITKDKLIDLSDTGKMPCRYGKLNIIFATTPEEYAAWILGRHLCSKEMTKDKDRDINHHNTAKKLLGVISDHDSGD